MAPYRLALALLLAPAAAAADPRSVLDLLRRIPDLPATAEESVKWFDQRGRLVHPGFLGLKADLDADQRASDAALRKVEASSVATAAHGLQEPAVQAALEASRAWTTQQLENANAPRRSSEAEEAEKRAAQKTIPALEKPKAEYDSPGCNSPCLAQWKAYGEKLWPLVLARETEVLQEKRAALREERASLLLAVEEADRHLRATRFGADAKSQADRAMIAQYHRGMLAALSRLVDETETAAKRAARTVNAGVERMFVGLSR